MCDLYLSLSGWIWHLSERSPRVAGGSSGQSPPRTRDNTIQLLETLYHIAPPRDPFGPFDVLRAVLRNSKGGGVSSTFVWINNQHAL